MFGFTDRRKRILMKRFDGIAKTEARYGRSSRLDELNCSLWKELESALCKTH